MRRQAILAVILSASFALLVGCNGELTSVSLAGTWTMNLEMNYSPMPGFLRGGVDYIQDAPVSQTNGAVASSFQDNWGNDVEMTGRLNGGHYRGNWEVRTPAGRHLTVSAVGHYSPSSGTIDGMMVVTFDSGFDSLGEQFPFWAMVNGGFSGSEFGPHVPGLLAFVGHGYSEDVDVVDIDSMTVIDTIVGAGGYRMVLTDNNGRLYGTTGGRELTISNAVTFTLMESFDPVDQTELGFSSSELEPIAISIGDGNDARVYIGDEQGNAGFFVLEVELDSILKGTFLPGVDEPENAVVGPNDQFVYVVDNTDALKIDTFSLQIVGRERVGSDAHGVAVSRDGTRLYAKGTGGIQVIDTSTMTTVTTIAGAGRGYYLELGKDGRRLYSANSGTSLTVIDTSNNTLIRDVTLSAGSARGVTTTPGGGTILVATRNGLIKLDAATLQETGFLAGSYQSVVTQNFVPN